MAELAFARGRDSYANQARPNTTYPAAKYLPLKTASGASARALVHLPLSGIAGRVITGATLSAPVRGAWAAQNVLVAANAAAWAASRVTWNKRPALRGATITAATTALTDKQRWSVDVTALVQEIANGAKDYGFTVWAGGTTGAVYSFDSGAESWVLTVETSDQPQQPDSLAPDAGLVSIAKPTLTWVLGDTAFGATTQDALEVQIDPAANGVAPAWTSGVVTSTVPQLDLAATTYPGLALGATTQWRVRVQDAGVWSAWSDWASITRAAKPTLTVTSPTGGSLFDPSPIVEFSSSSALYAYRVQVAETADPTKVLYDSGQVATDGTAVSHQIPARVGARPVFADDRSYTIGLLGYDDPDRVASPGDPAYARTDLAVAFDDDVHPPVTGVFATQVGDSPKVKVRFTRAAAADGWVIIRDGEVIARLEHDDPLQDYGPVTVDAAGGWNWIDYGASPWRAHAYEVKALLFDDTTGAARQSTTGGFSATVTTEVKGVWLIRDGGEMVVLSEREGQSVAGFNTLDRRATYKPPHVGYDVDIITAFEGVTGSYVGAFDTRDPDQADARTVMRRIKANPAEPVRLVYLTVSVPVLLRNVKTGLPTTQWKSRFREHEVTFEFFQCAEFEVRV